MGRNGGSKSLSKTESHLMLLLSCEMSGLRMASFQQERKAGGKEEETLKMLTTRFLKLWGHVWLCLQGNATAFPVLSAHVRSLTRSGKDSMSKVTPFAWAGSLERDLCPDSAAICETTLPAWMPWWKRWCFWLSWRIPALVKLIFQILQNHFLVLLSFSLMVIEQHCFPIKEGKEKMLSVQKYYS